MFFSDLAQIPAILHRTNCAIIALPNHLIDDFTLPSGSTSAATPPLNSAPQTSTTFTLTPDPTKSTPVITIDQIRSLLAHTATHQSTGQIFIIKHAELMNPPAANAFLKTLEEPRQHYHFLLLTAEPAQLLPTIRSRAQIFHYYNPGEKSQPDPVTLDLAKKLITTSGPTLVPLADQLAKKPPKSSTKSSAKSPAKTAKSSKNSAKTAQAKSPQPGPTPRTRALTATAAAIQLLTSAFYQTHNPKLLRRLAQLLALHQAISQGGHIKLQILACLS